MTNARPLVAAAAPFAVLANPYETPDARHDGDGFSRRRRTRGVNVYIVSTGIDASLSEFGGRALLAHDALGDRAWWDGSFDPHGHGTWLASIVGGGTYGVAPKARMHAVRAFDEHGVSTPERIQDALMWIAVNHAKPAVALLPFAFDASPELDHAAEGLVWAGITVIAAAGDSAGNAARRSPARNAAMITVGAVDRWQTRAAWSAYGSCIDLYAPGEEVMAVGTTNGEAKILDGTAAAAALVAGVAAMQLETDTFLTPQQVRTRLLARTKTETPDPPSNGSGRWRLDETDVSPVRAHNGHGAVAPKTHYRLERSPRWADIDRDGRYGFAG